MATKKLQILNSLVSHDTLTNLDAADQHPIEAVTGLKEALSGKADLVDGKIPVEQLPEGIGSGEGGAGGLTEVSWEDIQNKPFGEGGMVTVEFPTDISGSVTISSQPLEALGGLSFNYVKVDNKFSSAEEIIGAPISATANGQTHEFTVDSSHLMDVGNGFVVIYMGESVFLPACLNVDTVGISTIPTKDALGEDLTFNATETGLYFLYIEGMGQTNSIIRKEIKKIDKKYLPDDIGSGSGGVSSWNDLTDKPFGEEGFEIEWDGTPTNEFVNIDGLEFYKVSDTYFEAESLIGGTFNIFVKEDGINLTNTISSDIIEQFGNNCFGIMSPDLDGTASIIITSSATTVGEFDFPSAGIWFISVPDIFYTNSLEMIQIKKIDKKYLPDDIGSGSGASSWNDLTDKPFYEEGLIITVPSDVSALPRISSQPLEVLGGISFTFVKVNEAFNAPEETYGALIKVNNDGNILDFIIDDSYVNNLDNGFALISFNGGFYPLVVNANTVGTTVLSTADMFGEDMTFNVAETGCYVLYIEGMGSVISYSNGELKQLDEKFIPDVFVKSTNMGAPNGVATLDADGKVPASQLPDNIGSGSGGGSGVTSWNDLEDKPFSEIGTQVKWDGIPTSVYESLNVDGTSYYFYKVAEAIDTILDGTVDLSIDGNAQAMLLASDVLQTTSGGENGIYIVNVKVANSTFNFDNAFGGDLTFKETGLYFMSVTDDMEMYVSLFTSADYGLKQLDPKFIPNYFGETGFYTDCDASKATATISIPVDEENFGVSELRYLKFAEPIDGSIQGYLLSILSDGENIEMIMGSEEETYLFVSDTGSEYGMYVLNIKTDNETVNMEDFGLPIFTVEEAGLYVFDMSVFDVQLNYFKSPDYGIIKIDEKYLPDGIGGGTGYPHYTGGYLFNFDENTYLAFNYYNLMASVTDYNNLPYEAGIYNIQGTSPFIFTFVATKNIDNNSNIIVSIANKLTGDTSGVDKAYDSDVHVELYKTRKLQVNQWYTYYCVYVQSTGKWEGHLTNTTSSGDNDTSALESKINSLEQQINWKQDKNLVTSINKNSSDTQYPSAKLLYDTKVDLEAQITDAVSTKQDKSNLVTSVNSYSNDEEYPSAKLLYDIKTSIENVLQFDNAPTANSTKLVKSGAIASALNDKVSTSTLNNSVNNLTTEINKKANQAALDTAVSDLTTEIGKKANSDTVYTKNEIDGLITGVFYYKGSVDTFAELPATANVGDTYNVKNADTENNVKAGDNVVWCEIDGVGHWDVLSGIVDLSAYSTSEEIQGKLDEVQGQLDEKANKSDIPTLDEVPTKTDLSAVALSNNYLDLDNKPCYETGVELNVTFASGYEIASKDFLKSGNLRFIKIADYDISKRMQDYINGFVSMSYQYSTTPDNYTYTEPSNWIMKDNGIVIYEFTELYTEYIYAAIVPKDNLTCTLINGDNITFSSSGIYIVADTRGYSSMPNQWYYVSNIQFKTIYYPININLLPQEIVDLQTTKVDVDPNARLMTNSEASKLSSIQRGANNYTLPTATTDTLGGVKIGDNLSISEDGTISATSLAWDNVDGKPELYTKDEVYNKDEINSIQTNLNNSIQTTKTNLENSITTKVDKVTGSRLMTEEEGTKLAGINAPVAVTNNYNDLENAPCYLTGVDETFVWDGNQTNKIQVGNYVKIADIIKGKTLLDYKNSFKYFLFKDFYQKVDFNSDYLTYTVYTNDFNQEVGSSYFYRQDGSTQSGFIIVLYDNSTLGTYTYPESGIYSWVYSNKHIQELKFEGQFTKLKSGYIPAATTETLGGVKVGANLSVSADGTISATSLAWDNVKGKPELYTKSEVYNKSEVDTSLNAKVDKVTGSRLMTDAEGTKLAGIAENANNYILPAATASSLGGVKVGANLTVSDDGTLSATSLDWNNVDGKPELYTKSEVYNKDEVYSKIEADELLNNKQDKSNLVTSDMGISSISTDEQYPSAKLLYDILGDCSAVLDEIGALIGE